MQVAAADADDNPHLPIADHTAGINASVPPHNEERRDGDLEVGRDERHSDRKQPYIYRLLAKEYDSRRMTGIMRDHDASPSPRHRLLIMRQPAAAGHDFSRGEQRSSAQDSAHPTWD